jgi:hypothetical protein
MPRLAAAAALVALLVTGVAVEGALKPVAIVGRIPALSTGKAWRLVVRAPRTPMLTAAQPGRSLTFRTRRIRAGHYASTVRLPVIGRWILTARIGRSRYRLGVVHVVARPYHLAVPSQLVADPDGSLLVAERGVRYQVTRIDLANGLVSTFSTLPVEPYGLAWQGDRLLVTTHAGIYAIPAHGGRPRLLNAADVAPIAPGASAVFYGNETQIGRIDLASGTTTPFPTPVTNPHAIVIGRDGRLLVADTGSGRVLSVDPASGAATTVAAGLTTPMGLTVGVADDVVVAEHDTGWLLSITGDGVAHVLATGLRKPYAVAVAGDGNYYVTEIGGLDSASGRLVRVTPAGVVGEVRLRR